MRNPSRRSDLSNAQKALLTVLQRLNFGRIEALHVQGGEPVFQPAPRIIREHKFGGDNQSRPESGQGDFLLKSQVLELFETIEELGEGVIESLEVKHGLPFRMLLPQTVA